MAQYKFDAPRTCPACHAEFLAAEQQKEFHPVIVVRCPQCGKLLWRPGFDADSKLFLFDPNADDAI
jgi:predicted Zn finger-like uncharacterized protein